ncbi:MAG: mannose-6-phosphate isomerase, class I [Spirochaetaceae bacterium]|nr:mannose-6-phosphate isomerase, class I [Spirochaetaceae bacterium]
MKNIIHDYAWGSVDAIPRLLGYDNREKKPQAELWMGSHHRGASLLIRDEGTISLSTYINNNRKDALGEKIADLYGDLPFLFKVLAAGNPLSIQVHPGKKQAEEGYARENKLNVPLDAYNRNYKDNNHKPELICALTPFLAMRGFRTFDRILGNFQKAGLRSFMGEIETFSENCNAEGLKEFFNSIMLLHGERKQSFIKELVKAAETLDSDIFNCVLKLYDKYPQDVAIAAPLYLNLVKLEPGQALYLSAGVLHAYLDGMGIELMASSDNVLRGGLTSKYIDRNELIRVLDFSGSDPQIIEAETVNQNISTYRTPFKEFELTRVGLDENSIYKISEKNTVQILFVTQGVVSFINEMGETLSVVKGESVFVPYGAGPWTASGKALMFRAAVPGEPG